MHDAVDRHFFPKPVGVMSNSFLLQSTQEVTADEQHTSIDLKKLSILKPVFKRDGGTVTAANASALNDGAAALVLMSGKKLKELGLKPLAKVLGKQSRN